MLKRMFGTLRNRLAVLRERRSVLVLVRRGLRLGRNVLVMPGVSLDRTYPWLIEIGDGCRISRDVRIIAHDATAFADLGITRLGEVRILADTFVGERAIILPGVTIGPHALVTAGSVVNRDVGAGMIVAGNPARVVGRFEDVLERTRTSVMPTDVHHIGGLLDGGMPRDVIRDSLRSGRDVYIAGAHLGSPFYYNTTDAELDRRARDAFARSFGVGLQGASLDPVAPGVAVPLGGHD